MRGGKGWERGMEGRVRPKMRIWTWARSEWHVCKRAIQWTEDVAYEIVGFLCCSIYSSILAGRFYLLGSGRENGHVRDCVAG